MKKTTMPSLTAELKGIEHLASAVLLCDIEGHILYMNPVSYTHLTLPTIYSV